MWHRGLRRPNLIWLRIPEQSSGRKSRQRGFRGQETIKRGLNDILCEDDWFRRIRGWPHLLPFWNSDKHWSFDLAPGYHLRNYSWPSTGGEEEERQEKEERLPHFSHPSWREAIHDASKDKEEDLQDVLQRCQGRWKSPTKDSRRNWSPIERGHLRSWQGTLALCLPYEQVHCKRHQWENRFKTWWQAQKDQSQNIFS